MRDYRHINEADYEKHLWKRRLRIAVSAPHSDREILLFVLWKTGERPTETIRKDRLLWPMYVLRTDWIYRITDKDGYNVQNHWLLTDEKEALAQYKKLCKEFPRSKEIDYGLPFA